MADLAVYYIFIPNSFISNRYTGVKAKALVPGSFNELHSATFLKKPIKETSGGKGRKEALLVVTTLGRTEV
jgi:hypothetical protein